MEILLFAQFIPYLLLARTTGRWLGPLLPAVRAALIVAWPLRARARAGDFRGAYFGRGARRGAETQQEGIEALMEAAQEEGILASDEAQLIEQVVEFSDKRVLELMTPRPDIVAISAGVDHRADAAAAGGDEVFPRDRVPGDAGRRAGHRATGSDLLQIPESEAHRRTVREIAQPALFVPKPSWARELLKEMQRRNQHMAIAVDEHGLVAGVVTVEDLVEEIVGEMGKENGQLAPDIVREADGSVVLRGSVSVGKVQELLGIEFAERRPRGRDDRGGIAQ